MKEKSKFIDLEEGCIVTGYNIVEENAIRKFYIHMKYPTKPETIYCREV